MNVLHKAIHKVSSAEHFQLTNSLHPRVERRRDGVSARQQRRRIRKQRRHNLLFNREVF